MQKTKSNLILSIIEKQLDRNIKIKSVKTLKLGDILENKSGQIATILSFACICNQFFAWIEISLGNGRAVHYGVKLIDIL